MSRKSNGPWWNAQKGKWFVWHEGKRVNLKTDDEREALRRWHRLLGGVSEKPLSPEKPKPNTITVKQLADAFLADAEGRIGKACLQNYSLFLKALIVKCENKQAEMVTVGDAEGIRKPNWSSSYFSGFIGCVMTVYRWGLRNKLITLNPLANLRKPPKASRGAKAIITEDVHQRLMAVASPELQTLLTLLRETGCRPSELARLTAKDVDLVNRIATLHEHKTDHTGKPRILFLTPKAVTLLAELVKVHPEGELLRNHRGNPWVKDAIRLALKRASQAAGVKAIAHGYRHTFATDALTKGVPEATVAALLGHSSTAMIFKHYGHLTSQTRTLLDALNRVRG